MFTLDRAIYIKLHKHVYTELHNMESAKHMSETGALTVRETEWGSTMHFNTGCMRTIESQLFPEGVLDGPVVQRSIKQDVNVLRDSRLQITAGPDTIGVNVRWAHLEKWRRSVRTGRRSTLVHQPWRDRDKVTYSHAAHLFEVMKQLMHKINRYSNKLQGHHYKH